MLKNENQIEDITICYLGQISDREVTGKEKDNAEANWYSLI